MTAVENLSSLKHVIIPLPDGGEVVVIDQGAVLTPEIMAMMCALHSRSPAGVRNHLETVSKRGPDNFLQTYYVGYGDKSIGDNAYAYVFIEGVSMLVAKAVQDFLLYNGQEVSTRYVDFAHVNFINPLKNSAGDEILEQWREFYLRGIRELNPFLKRKFPRDAVGGTEPVYEKAIKARAFDIMRAFLPAGASTNLAWSGNVRQIDDHLLTLRNHPLQEVRRTAHAMTEAFRQRFPSSFAKELNADAEYYAALCGEELAYYTTDNPPEFQVEYGNIRFDELKRYKKILAARPEKPRKLVPPYQIREAGDLRVAFLLDFGSFRDLQRHRSVIIRMPLLTAKHGFEEWYLDELPETLRSDAKKLLESQVAAIKRLECSPLDTQYFLPMGFRCPIRMTGTIPALTYLTELRATRFVHPTLRKKTILLAQALQQDLKLTLHLDPDPDPFDVRRGLHDIVEKSEQ